MYGDCPLWAHGGPRNLKVGCGKKTRTSLLPRVNQNIAPLEGWLKVRLGGSDLSGRKVLSC